MSEHAPGPWEPYFYESPRKARQFWGVGAAGIGLLGIASHVRSEADARLIAAAPDLLRELKIAVHFCGCSTEERLSGHKVDCWAPDAKAAIAKAEGR